MNHIKTYGLAVADIAWITTFILSELDPHVRSIGLIVGVLVGVFTLWKLKVDIQLKIQERKMKEIEFKIKLKDWEDRIKKEYE